VSPRLSTDSRSQGGEKTNSRDRAPFQDRIALQVALPGTWLMNIKPEGDGAPLPFVVIGQFSTDGNFVSTESDLYAPPAGTPGQGVWEPASSRSFDLVQFAFLFDVGQLIGKSKVRGHGQLDQSATAFKGTYKIEVLDTAGVVQFAGTGTFDGVPVGVEP
jgi:hypothetical protein